MWVQKSDSRTLRMYLNLAIVKVEPMLTYTCHPAVEKMLTEDQELSRFRNGSNNIHFITTYLPSHSDSPHRGLEEAVWFRLSNPGTHLVILSFPNFEFIKKHDVHGILNLKGTFFLRLPVGGKQLSAVLSKCVLPLEIPTSLWKRFIIDVYTSQLKEEISKMRHGGTLAIGNAIIYPLRAACMAYSNNPSAYAPIIKTQLFHLQEFLRNEKLSRFIFLSDKVKGINDDFFENVTALVTILNKLPDNAEKNLLKMKELIREIDTFNLIFSELIDL